MSGAESEVHVHVHVLVWVRKLVKYQVQLEKDFLCSRYRSNHARHTVKPFNFAASKFCVFKGSKFYCFKNLRFSSCSHML